MLSIEQLVEGIFTDCDIVYYSCLDEEGVMRERLKVYSIIRRWGQFIAILQSKIMLTNEPL
jgi:hypothetical protein